MRKIIVLAGALLFLAGCTGTADVVSQLTKDPATSCAQINTTTPWGNINVFVVRSNSEGNSAASSNGQGCAFNHAGSGSATTNPTPATVATPAKP